MSRTREKKSFTLTAEALAVLAEFQEQVHAASQSAALERLLKDHQERRRLEELNASMASYYDECTADEVAEQDEWGAFASAQFKKIRETDGR